MSSHTYRVVRPCRLLGAGEDALNAILSEAGAEDRQPALLGSRYERSGCDGEHLSFVVAASDLEQALSTVAALADNVVRLVESRVGAGVLALEGDVRGEPVQPLADNVLYGSDLDTAVQHIDQTSAVGPARPQAQLIRRVRLSLGRELPPGTSCRVRLGRVWTPCDPRPDGGLPWRMRPGPEVGLPRSAELATLAGARFEVEREGIIRRTAELQTRCAGTGWTVVYCIAALEEWLGRQGFAVTVRHADDRASLTFLPVADPLDLVWFHGTSGAKVGLGTDELMGRLQAWVQRCNVSPVAVSDTGVTLYFHELPNDLGAFAAEMLTLCPRARAVDATGMPTDASSGEGSERRTFQALGDAVRHSRCLRMTWD